MSTATAPPPANITPSATQTAGSPLSPEHHHALDAANRSARKIFAAAKVAGFNGYASATFAVFSLIFGLFSVPGLLIAIGLACVARNEFRGRNLVRSLDPRGPELLGWNQIGLIGLIVVYSLWNIYAACTGPNPYQQHILDTPELASILNPIAEMHATLTAVVYGAVIVITAIAQGLNARYYFKRTKLIHAHLAQTPGWILDLQRRRGG